MSSRLAIRLIISAAFILLVVSLAALGWTQRKTIVTLREQLRVQQGQLRELDRSREEIKAAQHLKNQQGELERLRENNLELLRLRNETRQLREQLAELDTLRAANAELLRAVQSTPNLQSNQLALISAARRRGAILGLVVRSASDPQPGGAPAGRTSGAVVTSIDANSPVAESGLKVGDLIYALDGRVIANASQLQTEMLTKKPGETVVVYVIRDNTPLRFSVKTRAWPE
jgi:C-terminal processing protease CtpA/Prc